MKKIFLILSMSLLLVACDSKQQQDYANKVEEHSQPNENAKQSDTLAAQPAEKFDQQSALQEALDFCKTQVDSLPEQEREDALETCKCAAQNTDFEALNKAEQSQDFAAIEDIMTKAFEKCMP